jgi:putative addiction module killer protein
MEIEIKIYRDQVGKEPFSNWLLKLDSKTQDIIIKRLNRIKGENFGDCKNLGNEIYELRFFFDGGYRVYLAKRKKL